MKRILSISEFESSMWKEWLLEALGSNLISAFLHGDCLMPGFNPFKENWEMSFILKDNSPESLEPLQGLLKSAAKTGVSFGFFFTKESIEQSKDAFPLEFLHIANRHACILGEDPLPNFTIDLQALRLQCERELRGQLIQLRRHFVYMKQGKTLLDFFLDAERQVLPLFYGVYFLNHKSYPESHEVVYEEYPFLKIQPPTRDEKEVTKRAHDYIFALTKTVNTIDSMEIQ